MRENYCIVRFGVVPRRRKHLGAAAVEFAVVLPVILLLFIGMLEISHAFTALSSLTNAAREGCRHAILRTATLEGTQGIVEQQLRIARISGHKLEVLPNPEQTKSGEEITVSLSVPYTAIGWLPKSTFFSNRSLTASVVMQKE